MKHPSRLIDLKLSRKEMKDEAAEVSPAQSQYSWGLQIRLEKEELDKLGVKTLPAVHDEWHFLAVADVTSVSTQKTAAGDEDSCVCLQIKMMQIVQNEPASMEKGEKETPASEARETRKAPRAKTLLTGYSSGD